MRSGPDAIWSAGTLFIVIAGSPRREGSVSEEESVEVKSPSPPAKKSRKEKPKDKVSDRKSSKKEDRKKKGDASPQLSEDSD